MAISENEQHIEISSYIEAIAKHKWLVIICFAVSVGYTVVQLSRMVPAYMATAIIAIENKQTTSPLTGSRIDFETYYSQSMDFNTHMSLMKSRPVLEHVVKVIYPGVLEQKDAGGDSSDTGILSLLKKNLYILFGKKMDGRPLQDKMDTYIDALKNKINIEGLEETRLLRVSVRDYNPDKAAEIANSLSEAYIEFNISTRIKSSQKALNWMTDQLYELKKRLEDSEREFVKYKQEEKLFSIQGKQNVITQKIGDFNESYLKVRNRRVELDMILAELKKTLKNEGQLSHISSFLKNQRIENLYSQLIEMEVEETRLTKVFKEKHPKLVQLRSQMEKTRATLKDELQKELDNLKSEHSVLVAKENVLQETISGFESDALETNSKELNYSILERNVEMNQNLYDTLLAKIKEATIVDNLDVSNIRIVEEAIAPKNPINMNKKKKLFFGVMIGLIVGVGLALFLEYMDQTIRTEEDVEKYLGIPVLSLIPVVETAPGKNEVEGTEAVAKENERST